MKGISEEALHYREMGISVIPMRTYLDERGEVKKKPLIAWTEFQTRLPSTDEIRAWFTKNPKALIGGVCGKISNLCSVDADNREALNFLGGLLVKEAAISWKIPTSKTPRGEHCFFTPPENCPGPVSTPQGLDFRGEGSLIILPPSCNCQGQKYEWLPGKSLDEIKPPPLPQTIIDFVRSNSFSKKPGEGFNDQMFQDGNRDNSLFHTALCLLKGGDATRRGLSGPSSRHEGMGRNTGP